MEQKKYEPVGHCIYCGGTEQLSDEHIIPYGLGGNLELPKASCEEHRKVTGKFEGRVLRGPMWAVRAILNIQSRRPHERPTKGKLTIVRDGKKEIVRLPLAEYPVILHFPMFAPPTVLGRSKVDGIQFNAIATAQFGGPPIEEVKESLGADEIYVTHNPKWIEFARLIAKIAYSFAFAERAPGLLKYEESPVVRAILGETGDIGHWVGSMTELPRSVPGSLHEVYVGPDQDGRGLVVGQFKLFAYRPTPTYGVILGKLEA